MQQIAMSMDRPKYMGDSQLNDKKECKQVDADTFRLGMSRLGGACTIISSATHSERAGLTATAVCSVSVEPPRLLVCVNRTVRAHNVIVESQKLGVNVLGANHVELAKRFAGMVNGVIGQDRFDDGEWCDSDSGVPLLKDALVSFECKLIEHTVSGTHSIFLCQVNDVLIDQEKEDALMYFNRQFVPIIHE